MNLLLANFLNANFEFLQITMCRKVSHEYIILPK